jgi:hypothetical protein
MRHRTVVLRHRMIVLLIVSAALLLVGCETTMTKFYATQRSLYMESSPPRMQSFGPGEVVCLVVEGYGGQTVTVNVLDMLTGRAVGTMTSYIPEGRIHAFPFDLSSGSYLAELSVSGANVASWKFNVSR